MNTAPVTTSEPPPAAQSASAGATPDWSARYFEALAEHRQKARAAQAAGQPLPSVVRRRRADPRFAEHEAEILECLGDVLESEAIRRATATGPIYKPCTDSLLRRLLNIFHPKGDLIYKETLAGMAPYYCQPERPIRAKGGFNFQRRLQALEFKQWEREQAISTAIDLFYMSPEELDALCPLPNSIKRSLTTWPSNTPEPSQTRSRAEPPLRNPASASQSHPNRPSPPSVFSAASAASVVPPSQSSPGSAATQPLSASAPLRDPSSPSATSKPSTPSESAAAPAPAAAIQHPHQENPSAPSAPSAVKNETTDFTDDTDNAPPAPPREKRRRLLWGLAMPPGSKAGVTLYPGFIPPLMRAGAIPAPGKKLPPSSPSIPPPRPDSS